MSPEIPGSGEWQSLIKICAVFITSSRQNQSDTSDNDQLFGSEKAREPIRKIPCFVVSIKEKLSLFFDLTL